MTYDMYAVTKDIHQVDIGSDQVANINAGAGLILDDPLSPIVAPSPPFFDQQVVPRYGSVETEQPIDLPSIVSATTTFIQAKDTAYLSRSLYANLKASYGFASANAAFQYVKEVATSGEMMMAIIEVQSSGPSIDEGQISWADPPSSEHEAIASEEERLDQFIRAYGSHYVQAVQHGYRIAIAGTLSSSLESERQSFSAGFKATFSGGGAGGSITTEQREVITSGRVELKAQVVAGRIDPERGVQLTGFSEITEFLRAIREGKIALYRGPVSVLAKSYYHTLLAYPRTRAGLAPHHGDAASSPFGVPAGTIIAWAPRRSDIRLDDLGKRTIVVPQGWALADGSNDTPDLIGRFPMGAINADDVCSLGGSDKHSHTGMAGTIPWSMATNGDGTGERAVPLANHQHSLAIDPASHLPPFGRVMFLVKL